MNYEELHRKGFGDVLIRDLKDYDLESLEQLVHLYRESFPVHSIFKKSEDEVLSYLRDKIEETENYGGGLIVAVNNGGNRIGGILVRKEHQEEDHTRWKYNHLAVHKDFQRMGIGTALLSAADRKIRNLIGSRSFRTAKIEVSVAESEKEMANFYEKNGFELEARKKSHYRPGELVYEFGKEIS